MQRKSVKADHKLFHYPENKLIKVERQIMFRRTDETVAAHILF
jgi:hypothetical protein